MTSPLLSRMQRALRHLRRGTLAERLQMEWRERRRHQRLLYWRSLIGKQDAVETVLQPGIRMRLWLDTRMCQRIYCDEFELSERQFLNAFLRPGDVFVDVGANIGLFTLIAAQRLGSQGRVYAFEPSSKTVQRLLENIQLNGFTNVTCFPLALSDRVTEQEMNVSLEGLDACNSLAPARPGHSVAVEVVRTTLWDTFAREHDLVGAVTMMKIDVEGWEPFVLAGARQTLSRPDAPHIQIEFAEANLRAVGSSGPELYRLLEEFGYHIFSYDPNSATIVPQPIRDRYPSQNLIATKAPEQIQARLKAP